MFNNTPQRNFEWFEISFSKKIQTIINENKEDSLSWIRDLFISLLLAFFSLFCELFNTNNSPTLQVVLKCGTILSLLGLLVWFAICIIRYNKRIKKIKSRLIPHSSKNFYTIDESVQLFDNDICNELILSSNYITLADATKDESLKKFYYIEAIHYYFKSIRGFNSICVSASKNLDELFSNESGCARKINTLRLKNYLELVGSIRLNPSAISDTISEDIDEYYNSHSVVRNAFSQTLSSLKAKYPNIKYSSEDIIKM